jgi:RNA polymerase sigma factor (sigma-70 family)
VSLILEHIPYVKKLARKYSHTVLGQDDAEGEGYLALVEAAHYWDASKNPNFTAYVLPRIKYRMIDAYRACTARPRGGYKSSNPDITLVQCTEEEWENFSSDLIVDFYDVETALNKLDVKLRYIVLCKASGYRMNDIAISLGVSPSRVTQLLDKGRSELAYSIGVPYVRRYF